MQSVVSCIVSIFTIRLIRESCSYWSNQPALLQWGSILYVSRSSKNWNCRGNACLWNEFQATGCFKSFLCLLGGLCWEKYYTQDRSIWPLGKQHQNFQKILFWARLSCLTYQPPKSTAFLLFANKILWVPIWQNKAIKYSSVNLSFLAVHVSEYS